MVDASRSDGIGGAPGASFGAWVRDRRAALDLTQAELAQRVACAVITVRKIESDERRPSKAMAERLADALAVDEGERDRFVAVARATLSPVRLPPPAAGLAAASIGAGGASAADGGAASKGEPSIAVGVPAPLHRILGRDDDLARVTELLACTGGTARLVTITGAPGVGKTRLAVEVARRVAEAYDVAAVFVELAGATDIDGVKERIASAVAIVGPPGADRFDLARSTLARVPTLLVLDNVEQVVDDAAPVVGDLLAAAPDLVCLVTSRVRLDVYGEHEHDLAPLPVPEADDEGAGSGWWHGADGPAPSPAVELFVERAGATRAGVELDADGAAAVADICRRLDGLPLAIELAARRVRDTAVTDLAADLARGLGALGTGGRDVDARHRTMTGAVEWSYALLSGPAQRLLRALSVAEGSFGLDDAAALAAEPADAAAPVLQELVDHGLLRRTASGLALFEVVRSVAAARLDDLGEADAVRRRHAEHHLARVLAVAPECIGDEDATALAAIDASYEDLRAALGWAFDGSDPALGRRLSAVLVGYWYPRCLWREGVHWAQLAYASTDDPVERAWPAAVLATLEWLDDAEQAQALMAEAAEGARLSGDDLLQGQIVGGIGFNAMMAGDLETATRLLEQSGAHFRAAGTKVGEALTELRLGRVAGIGGDLDGFVAHTGRAAALAEEMDRPFTLGIALGDLSEATLAQGDVEVAAEYAVDAYARLSTVGVDWYSSCVLTCLVNVLAVRGDLEVAAGLCGLIEGWLEDLDAPMLPTWGQAYARHRADVEAALGDRFDDLATAGRVLPRTVDHVRSLAAGA